MLSKGQNWAVKIMAGVNGRDGERRETEQRKERLIGLIKCKEGKAKRMNPLSHSTHFY